MGAGRSSQGCRGKARISECEEAEEEVKRYDIWRAELDPAVGAKMKKTRPVVIVSLDKLNDVLDTVTVCPLTSQLHPEWRTRLTVKAGDRNADVAVEQIRTISKQRLGRKLGTLSTRDAALLRRVITELYGD
jgi:mRNA interferase MazF